MSFHPVPLAPLLSGHPPMTGWPQLHWQPPRDAIATYSIEGYQSEYIKLFEDGFVTYSVQLSAQIAAVEGRTGSTSGCWVE